jgi:hypothetical protein
LNSLVRNLLQIFVAGKEVQPLLERFKIGGQKLVHIVDEQRVVQV